MLKVTKQSVGLITLLTFLLGYFNLSAQNEPVPMLLKNGRFAFVGRKTKTRILEQEFDDARPFHHGFAFVKTRSKWGIIDLQGNFVLAPKSLFITELSKKIYGATENERDAEDNFWEKSKDYTFEKSFLINEKNEIINFCNEDEGCEFITNMYDSDFYIIHKENDKFDKYTILKKPMFLVSEIVKSKEDPAESFFDNLIKTSKYYTDSQKSKEEKFGISNFNNGFFKVYLKNKNELSVEGIDYMSITFKPLIGEKYYEYIESNLENGDFKDSLALVKKNEKYGFINSKGVEVVPTKYDDLGSFHEGFAIAKLNGAIGYINKKGEFLFKPSENFELTNFQEGRAIVEDKENESVYAINTKGEKVFSFPHKFYSEHLQFSNGKIIFDTQNDKIFNHFVYDLSGNIVYKLKDEYVSKFSKDGFAFVSSDNYSDKGKNLINHSNGQKLYTSDFDKIFSISTDSKELKLNTNEFEELNSTTNESVYDDILNSNLFWNNLLFVQRSGFKFYVEKDGFEYVE
ncbi:MAG: hypothetical protein RI943_1450 [Bacteroidota bacterium]|jgi:hypothetical protein